MDTSLGTIEDVERHIGVTVLGIIPHIEKEDVKERMDRNWIKTLSSDEVEKFARLTSHFDPKSISSEAFRTLRTNVSSVMAKTGGKVIMVSSSMLEEGKTTISTNLATVFAQSGKKTLLIDADLRRPTVEKIFGLERSPGLTDLLLDTRDPKDCYRGIDDLMIGKFGLKLVQATPGLEYLSILPAGRLSDKPSELLSTPAVDQLLANARQNFDIVIVDAAPILPVADGFVLAPKMDAIILTYQVGRVARDVLRRTKTRVQNVGGNVVGVILNDIQAEIGARHSDFSYYSYGYGEAFDLKRTSFDRLKRIFRKGTSPKRKPRRNSEAMKSTEKPPTSSGESREVREIMSMTDDDQK
jgi:capsular exopolysaccharide synthesis family protein